ncbi:hypothetical protein CBER1_07491 [Cercospora berteroae]|uniref:Uncharacterized protein n=1 Tax=Cercospora berteroae TaxID=357750 RepID=A0A2S6BUN5_9PEZI|nr:hypothetical protein CBER1_07491 [Cercospora berteroae]
MVAPTVKSIEHALGFKWKTHGRMHRATGTPLPLVEEAIEDLTASDARVENRHVVPDEEDLDSIDTHFDRIGPELWPDEGIPRNTWLVDANDEDFGGLHPRNLYFSVPEDYQLQSFQELLLYKVGIRLYEQRYEQRRKEVPCEDQDRSAIHEGPPREVTREDECPNAPEQTSSAKPQRSFSPATRSALRKHILSAFLQSESSEADELPAEVLFAIAAAVVDDKPTYKWRGSSYNVPEHMLAIGKKIVEQFSNTPKDELQPAASSANGRCEVIDLDLLSSDNEEEEIPEARTPSSPDSRPSQHNRAMPCSLTEMRAFLSTINFEVQYRIHQSGSPVVSLRGCYTSAKLFERIQASMPEDAQICEVEAFTVYFQGMPEIRVRKDREPDFQKLVHRMICEDVQEGFVAVELVGS